MKYQFAATTLIRHYKKVATTPLRLIVKLLPCWLKLNNLITNQPWQNVGAFVLILIGMQVSYKVCYNTYKFEFVGMKKVGGYKCITAYLFASSTMDFNKDFTKSCWMSSNGVMNE